MKRQWNLVARILGFFQSLHERDSYTPSLRMSGQNGALAGRICILKRRPRKPRSKTLIDGKFRPGSYVGYFRVVPEIPQMCREHLAGVGVPGGGPSGEGGGGRSTT